MSAARFDRARILDVPDPAVRRRRELALALAEAALDAVEPEQATRAALARLERRGERLEGATLFAFGKAAVPMARAAARAVSLRGGVVVALERVALPGLDVRIGGHPDPAPDALEVGLEVLARAATLGERDVALCLVSGGGSAMLELPASGVTLEELRRVARELMRAGADIAELNAVRGALSQLKGGGLARAIAPARVCNVILSDVPGHPLAVVASGPTCAPPEGAPDPSEVLARYSVPVSRGVRAALARPRDPVSAVIRSEVAADNSVARAAVIARARAVGVEMYDRAGVFRGEARELGASLGAADRAFVWGGETTVTVRGAGRGGRNQELVLGAFAGFSRGLLLAFGTDGVDGSSDAAGALIDEHAVRSARERGLDPARALADNDATAFFDALGTALRSGPTGTNVADLCLYLP